MDKAKYSREWIEQAEYDIDTGQVMLESRRYIYCVFMCHLSIEKALKALYVRNLEKNPPKVHSLVYLAKSININLSRQVKEFIEKLNKVSVPTRYPEELSKLLREYDQEKTQIIFDKSKKESSSLTVEFVKVRSSSTSSNKF